MHRLLHSLAWYHATRSIAVLLIGVAIMIEDNPTNRSTYVTAAIGLLAAEPVGRRERAQKQERRSSDDNGTG